MLPLSPPRASCPPAYPTRAGLLGDAGLRRQVLGALAAAALAGCGGEAVPQPPPGAPPAAGTPTAQPLRGEPAAAPQPLPQRLAGDVVAPLPARIEPVAPEPQPLGGKPAPSTAPEPQRLGGAMPPPPPPPPAPAKP